MAGNPDCNDNGIDDANDIAAGTSADCNLNTVPDECDLAEPSSFDCNFNGLVDSCEVAGGSAPDCNGNDRPDECDLIENDCDNNGVPNECDPDCDGNELSDACDIAFGFATDCNLNRIPDECDITAGTSSDGDEDGLPDTCSFWVSTTGFWSNAPQWDPAIVPDNDPPTVFHVTIANFNSNVTLDIDAEIQSLFLGPIFIPRGSGTPRLNITQGDLTIESPSGMQIEGDLFIGPGHGLVAGTTFGVRGNQPLQLVGGDAFIASRTPGDVMTARSGITGFGRITADFINEAYVSANADAAPLVITGPGSKVNNGLFEAISGGTLLITEISNLRALTVVGDGDYEASFGTIQLGEGGGSVGVSGNNLRVYNGGVVDPQSAWSLSLAESVLIAGGVFDPNVETTGFLDTPLLRIEDGVMNLGAETVANVSQLIVKYSVGGLAAGESESHHVRGLTPPVLNIVEGGRALGGVAEVGDGGAVEVGDAGQLDISGNTSVGIESTILALGLTPPVLRVKGGGGYTSGSLEVIDAGLVDITEAGSASIEGETNVGVDAARSDTRGLTPPVLNIAGEGRLNSGSIAITEGGEFTVSDQGQGTSDGDISFTPGAARGLTPPVLNIEEGGRVESGGDFSIETSANITVSGRVTVGGNFENESTDPTTFNWDEGTLAMGGGEVRGEQFVEIGSKNLGPLDLLGFNQNFAFGVFEVGTNAVVRVVDLIDNQLDGFADCDEASYVDVLIIQPGGVLLADECILYFKTIINLGGSVPNLGTRVIPIGGGDIDSNGTIDEFDFAAFLAAFGSCVGDAAFVPAADLDFDGCVTLVDYQAWYALYEQFGVRRAAGVTTSRQPSVSRAGADVSVRIEPAVATVHFGDVFTVNLVADIVPPVLGWGLDLEIADSTKLQRVGAPTIGAAWIAAPSSDSDGLAALAFPTSVSGGGVVLASVQLVATGLGQTELSLAVSAGDLAEGFALDPAGFAEVVFATASITIERAAPSVNSWNWVDVGIPLTANQPTYWSAATGQPAGVSPLTILDPGPPPGRPAPDGSGERVLRGFILAWAVNASGEEIRWNHLAGSADIVNYARGSAWEYNAYAFQSVNPAIAHGQATGTPGQLFLNGVEYDNGYDLLLLDFYAAGSQPFSLNASFGLDTELVLMPLDSDLRQETTGPTTTKASFTIWNQNEVKFTGLDRCVTCWDAALLSQYGVPNHFVVTNLQTNKGKAQIDGLASQLCNFDYDPVDGLPLGADPRDTISQAASLVGVAAKHVRFTGADPYEAAGTSIVGMGVQSGHIQVDVSGTPPPERPESAGQDAVAIGAAGTAAAPGAADYESADNAGAPIALAPNDRTSTSEKGSLLVFPKVELRWDATGTLLLQDTFIQLINDYPEDVQVQMYFVNGDPAQIVAP